MSRVADVHTAVGTAIEALDALSMELASPRHAGGGRLLQLVAERQRVVEQLEGLLGAVDRRALPAPARAALYTALTRSSQVGELARRAVEQHAALVARELQSLETLAASPDSLAVVGQVDAEG
jgi:hypothetical protein